MVGERLINDHNFECDNLEGMEVEHFLGFYEGNIPNGMNILMLKLKEKELWQRFFLDAGIGFWEEWDEDGTFCDYENMPPLDLAKKYSITNKPIRKIMCNGSYEVFSYIIFEIGEIRLKLSFLDTNDIDSETIIEKF